MDSVAQLSAALDDRYTIEREIGRGGMATVYLARDLKHDRAVAIKVLDPELGAVLGGDRFLSEIRVTANLHHPNLLPLFDSGDAAGLLYYVMPFIEGETLRTRLDRETQLPVDDAVRITIAIANALEYAHGHGVVHRDLKPENILLQAGQPIVADFGIALAMSKAGGARVTQTGLSLGTPQYMSPEQATGDRVIDARSDQFSLAAVLYEMLTGEPPHTGNNAQVIIARLLTEVPRPVKATRASVAPHIDAAVGRALMKSPADRFESVRAFADALAQPTAVAGTTTKTAGGRMMVMAAVAAVAVIAAIAAAVYMRPSATEVDPSMVVVVPTAIGNDAALTGAAARVDDAIAQGLGTLSWVTMASATAKKSGASIAATSSLVAIGDSVQLRMRLVDPTTEAVVKQLPAVTLSRTPTVAEAARATESVVTALGFVTHPKLGIATLPSGTVPALPVFKLFAQSMSHALDNSTRDAADLVVGPLRQVVASDSSFLQGKLWLGFAYEWFSFIGRNAGGAARTDTVRAWTAQARQDATSYEAALANFVELNLGEQGDPLLEAARQVLAMAPRSPVAGMLPSILEDQNRLAEAADRYTRLLAPAEKRDSLPLDRAFRTWISLGVVRHGLRQYDQSLAAFGKARALRPNDILALGGELQALAAMGRLDELNRRLPSVGSATTNGALFGFAGNIYLTVASELTAHGHPAEAKPLFQQAATWFDQNGASGTESARVTNNYLIRKALAFASVGRIAEAKGVARVAAMNDTSDTRARGFLGRTYADEGKSDSLRAVLAWLEQHPGDKLQGTSTYERAAITAHLGPDHWAEAVQLLELSLRQGQGYNIRSRLHWFADWQPLKDYPPFRKVLEPRG